MQYCIRDQQQQQRMVVMTKGEQQQTNMSLEEYDHFFNNRHPMDLTVDQLNLIIFMHCFIKLHHFSKMLILESLSSLDMVPPLRSTLRQQHDGTATPSPPLSLDEVKHDIDALGWQECPLGSIISVTPRAAAPAQGGSGGHSLMWSSRRLRSKRKRGGA